MRAIQCRGVLGRQVILSSCAKARRLGGWVLLAALLSNCSASEIKKFAEETQHRAEGLGAAQQASRPLAYPADLLEEAPASVQPVGKKPLSEVGEAVKSGETAETLQRPSILLYAPPVPSRPLPAP